MTPRFEEDTFTKIRHIAVLRRSPSGRRVLFSVKQASLRTNTEGTTWFLLETGGDPEPVPVPAGQVLGFLDETTLLLERDGQFYAAGLAAPEDLRPVSPAEALPAMPAHRQARLLARPEGPVLAATSGPEGLYYAVEGPKVGKSLLFRWDAARCASISCGALEGTVSALAATGDRLYCFTCSLWGEDDLWSTPLDAPGQWQHELALEGQLGWYLDTDFLLGEEVSLCAAAGERLVFVYGDSTGTRITAYDPERRSLVPLSPPELYVYSFLPLPEGGYLATGLTGRTAGELWRVRDGEAARLTHINREIEAWLPEPPEPLPYRNRRGDPLKGYVLRPEGWEDGAARPGFLLIHMGPRGTFAPVPNGDMLLLRSMGFYVFFSDIHGSSNVSRVFADIEDRMGTIDYEDLCDFTDAVLAAYPQIDPERLALGGTSYGGYMTNWIIGHTGRFRSAISMCSISNWASLYETTAVRESIQYGCVSGTPETNPEGYRSASPIHFAANAKTPTLFLQGTRDVTTPMEQAEQMYEVLRKSGVNTRLVSMVDEGHYLALTGRPDARQRRFREMARWLAETVPGALPLPRDQALLAAARDLIQIYSPSQTLEPASPHPYGEGAARATDYALDLCRRFGFRVNGDGPVPYAEIGEGSEMIAVLVHLDVVPMGENWAHGQGEISEGRLYGRGAIDDKGPAVAAIFAMGELLRREVPLRRRIRLLFGRCEETGDWTDLRAYRETEELPVAGFTPDADFPLIYAEKGISMLRLTAAVPEDVLQDLEGGSAVNAVPDRASCTYQDGTGTARTLTATGTAAHGSIPEQGDNAICELMAKLAETGVDLPLVRFFRDCIGKTVHGEHLGVAVSDEVSGPLTMNVGTIRQEGSLVTMQVDLRYPVTASHDGILAALQERAAAYGISVTEDAAMAPVFSDVNTPLVKTLLEAYRDYTGQAAEPMAIGGGTYARSMPNIVAFGPLPPGKALTEHRPDEYIELCDLFAARDIYTDALERLAQFPTPLV